MAINVLLLEDDANLGIIVQEHLQLNGFEVTLCPNGRDGLNEYKKGKFDICLVDIMMPLMDGFSFVREVRKTDSSTPLIFLTAKSLKEDKIEGFKIGCDDYITKPFSVEELLLRIQAVLRRTRKESGESTISEFEIGDYHFDSDKQVLKYREMSISLTSKESELLRHLCLNKGAVLDRGDALKKIWGTEDYFTGRSMDVYISKLRKYLKEDQRVQILNIHGKGFKLIIG